MPQDSVKADMTPSDSAVQSRSTAAMFLPKGRLQVLAGLLAMVFLASSIGYAVGIRSGDSATPAANSADVGFLLDMTAHHEQAVQLASMQLTRGSDPLVLNFAREILTMQSYEIGLMRMRLGTWGVAQSERPLAPMAWMGMSVPSVGSMPGMASEDELAALREASGAEADALFLALMSDHHAGGVSMAQAASALAGDQWIIDTADQMARVQASEIVEMEMARDAAGLAPLPPGFVPDFAHDGEPQDEMNMDSMDG